MKRIVFISAALAFCLTAAAQAPDTLRVRNVEEVTVITSRDFQTISLKGSANDSTFRYESSVIITPDSNVSVRESRLDLFNWDALQDMREQRRTRDTTYSIILQRPSDADNSDSESQSSSRRYKRVTTGEIDGWGFGFAMPYDGPAGIGVGGKAFSDIFVTLESVDFHFLGNHAIISAALNAGYRSFRLQDDGIFVKQDGKVQIAAIPSGLELKRSALRSNYLAVPGLLTLAFGRHGQLKLYGGAEICFNFNGRIKNKYTVDEPGVPMKYKDISLEPWTWNYVAGIKFSDIGIYAKYSPCPFLQEGTGPAFKTYSVGFLLDL
jgi:hypothetical protein